MERLTNEAIKVEASVDGMIGSFVDLANIKPRLRTYFGVKVKWEDGKWLTENGKS